MTSLVNSTEYLNDTNLSQTLSKKTGEYFQIYFTRLTLPE